MTKLPIFFSVDDFYLPFLAPALKSLQKNASTDYEYEIIVLHTKTVSEENQKLIIDEFNQGVFHLRFDDISDYVADINSKLHTRDYYTKSTYYRLFIPKMYPQYDKVLYLDADIIVLGDISEFFRLELKDNLVGAIVEDVMLAMDVFGQYVEKTLGIDRNKYFNAGILLMNAKLFRDEDVEQQFFDLLFEFTFYVVQDEDYLNVLCKDRVSYMSKEWNRTPIPGTELPEDTLRLIHYKMAFKPWKYSEVLYGHIFWDFAYQTKYFDTLIEMKMKNNDPKIHAKDQAELQHLIEYAIKDSNDPNNYYQTQLKRQNKK
ncbi:MAG: glycosyltransferase family 8 protein [Anaeroplasmataceae bacterium]